MRIYAHIETFQGWIVVEYDGPKTRIIATCPEEEYACRIVTAMEAAEREAERFRRLNEAQIPCNERSGNGGYCPLPLGHGGMHRSVVQSPIKVDASGTASGNA